MTLFTASDFIVNQDGEAASPQAAADIPNRKAADNDLLDRYQCFKDLAKLKAGLQTAVEALEKVKDHFCACSIGDEIIPQVVANDALAKIKGKG